jgi:hypothetical protein
MRRYANCHSCDKELSCFIAITRCREGVHLFREGFGPVKGGIMRIVTPEILSYFASVQSRIEEAKHIPFREVSVADWQPKPAECHKNVDYWISGYEKRTRVRGWLTWGNDESGSCHLIAHSVVDDDGTLYDITPIDPNTPPPMFLRHIGEKGAFDVMQPQWSWTTYPIIFEMTNESARFEDEAEQ